MTYQTKVEMITNGLLLIVAAACLIPLIGWQMFVGIVALGMWVKPGQVEEGPTIQMFRRPE